MTYKRDEVIADLQKWNSLEESELLTLLVKRAENAIVSYINNEDFNINLTDWGMIVFEISQSKLIKRGKEGTKQMTEQGYTLQFTDDDLKPYKHIFDKEKKDPLDFIIQGRASSWS